MVMIQIDMPMPMCCDECFALDDHGDYPFCLISQDQRGYTFNTRKNRMPTCPLKVQEPIKPLIAYDMYFCGNCKYAMPKTVNYCPKCGKKVMWS